MEVLCRDVRYDIRAMEEPYTSGAANEDPAEWWKSSRMDHVENICIAALLPGWERWLKLMCLWYALIVFFLFVRFVLNILSSLDSEEQKKIRTKDTKLCILLSTYRTHVPSILNMWNVWKLFILNAIYKISHKNVRTHADQRLPEKNSRLSFFHWLTFNL